MWRHAAAAAGTLAALAAASFAAGALSERLGLGPLPFGGHNAGRQR
jgi:hypothetical protein